MVSATVAGYIVGIIGNITSLCLFLFPLPTFYKIIKDKVVKEFNLELHLAIVLNCMLWIFYGMPFVHPDSVLIVTINIIGLVIELAYLAIFVFFSDFRQKAKESGCLSRG
ncbi:bidirectional sugar transporter SWEET7b-like [Momordica charantia]|uniref:Bidirectional sugar transporter SWEET7b-like n=1 Tax=Momordica charantia TaxID=3673 RepID=A0A6J1DAE8_MOMCH|nr:bidirectional sugar transporter SWEET7b-like [Momordica charantia]